MTTFTREQRKNLTKKKMAMPDGSYPIRNRSDLRNAISSYGRAKNKPAVKAWIISRAKELDSEDLIPEKWKEDITHIEYSTPYLAHHGVKGMKWGVRKERDTGPYSAIGNAARRKQNAALRTQKRIKRLQEKSKTKPVSQDKIKKLREKNKKLTAQSKAAMKNSKLELQYRASSSRGKRIVQNMLMDSYSAETYRLARAKGKSRVQAMFTPTNWYE